MYLHHVKIRNFRCLRELEVELSSGLNVIVGENNVGKTTFLDAIRVAMGPAAATAESVRLGPEDRHRQADGTYLDQPISVTLIFSALTSDEQAQFIDILNYDVAQPEKSTAQLNFRWTWNAQAERFGISRWGGAAEFSENGVPEDVLQTIPVTLLGALRDATAALLPGRNSRLAHLLRAHAGDADKQALVKLIIDANTELEKNPLIAKAQSLIEKTLASASGPLLGQGTAIKTAEPDFDHIVQSLRLVIARAGAVGAPIVIDELRSNGLGFNNLFFIATVMLELNAAKGALLPLLLVEEPEAHLHPQLQTLLSDFLNEPRELHPAKVQVVMTTHSPTVAAHVAPEKLRVLHRGKAGALHCASFAACGLTPEQLRQLRRMLDVTKASLLFAKGVILVEGITEALLVPVLAQRAGINLEHNAISVVPVCGVDFATISRLFGDQGLRIPLAVVTDGDAITERAESDKEVPWESRLPKMEGGKPTVCARVAGLLKDHKDHEFVGIFHSDVTLEYSLAAAGPKNPAMMCTVWEEHYKATPRTLNAKKIEQCGDNFDLKVLTVWRGICLANATCSKAEFAQAMAARLEKKDDAGIYTVPTADFVVPDYLQKAFSHVTASAKAAN
jgi:putative ATP-dependent endonuclease of OLD family